MRKFKKVLSVALAGAMILGLCACKDDNSANSGSVDNAAAKQYVYSYEGVNLGVDLESVGLYDMAYKDGRVYAIVEDYSNSIGAAAGAKTVETVTADVAVDIAIDNEFGVDNDMAVGEEDYFYTGPNYYLISANVDGSDQSVLQLVLDDKISLSNGYMSGIYLLEDGSVAAMYESYYEDLTDPVNPVYTPQYYLMKWDNQAKLTWTVDISPEDGSYIWAQSINADADGNLTIITGDSQMIGVDAQGNETTRTSFDTTSINNISQFLIKEDGTIYVTSYDDNWTKMYISTFDLTTGQAGEKIELPGNLTNYSLYGGSTTDLILSNSFGIYTYNIGDAEPVKIMDYINSDLATYDLRNICFIDEQHFVANYYDSTDYTTHIGYFTYVDPKDIPDQISVVLGCNYLGSDIKKQVIDFNRKNSQYRITVKDYSSYNTMEDYTLSYTQMNNDIISGQMPDIMVIDSTQDISSWVNKGLLADIEELIAKDEELSKVEYLQNVWKAFSVNDKLYTVVPNFSVQTMTARKDVVGDRSNWTMTEFMEFMNTQSEDVKAFGSDMLRDTFIYYLMIYCGSDFVDLNTGKCSFDSEEFVAMLEYANTLAEEYDEDYWMDYDGSAQQAMYRDKKAVLMTTYISNISDLVYSIHGTLGDEAAFVGFPGISGNSSVIQPGSNMFVLSAKSKNLDGAWEFVRYYLTDEFQNSEDMYYLPVAKSAFEAKAQKSMEKPYWTDENGEKVEYDNTYWMNEEEIVLEQFSQEEVDEICVFVYSVTKRAYYNQDIIDIVNEEAQSFFEGQKSAQDVAALIQNRVQLFVDENR